MGSGLYTRSLASALMSVVLVILETNSCVEPPMAQMPQAAASRNEVLRQHLAAAEGGGASSRKDAEGSPPFAAAGPSASFALVGGLVPSIPGAGTRTDERMGWLDDDDGGGGANPPATVFFTYDVSGISFRYEEALQSARSSAAGLGLARFSSASPFAIASDGVAGLNSQVMDAARALRVPDGKSRPGFALTGGIGMSANLSNLSAAMTGDLPHGGVFPNTGYIPGKMTTNLLAQGVNLGVEWRY